MNVPEADADFTPDVFGGTYLNMELEISRDGDRPNFDKVTKRLRDKDRLPIKRAQNNLILDTRMYKVEYNYEHKDLRASNTIAYNMFAQVGREGNRHVLFQEISDHRYDGTEVKE